MAYKDIVIAELTSEAAATRRMLERVPADKNDWQPHEKSMKLGRLAMHVAELPSYLTQALTHDELDFANGGFKRNKADTNEELLALHDESVREAVAALNQTTDEEFEKSWSLRNGEQVYMTMPKRNVLRSFSFSHLYHHRGQLSVYLRLLNVPLPGIYGPTADVQ
jgi:uncharacterized damage-inducible protein DinB